MNIYTLEEDIQKIKDRSPDEFNEVAHLTIPFYMFHQKMTNEIYQLEEEKYQITNTELDVLSCLRITGKEDCILSPTKIHERLLFTSGAITKVLKKLEEKKYIVRLSNKYDKRSKLVQLTPLGSEISKKALMDVLAYEEKCFSALSDEEKKTFKALFVKMLKSKFE